MLCKPDLTQLLAMQQRLRAASLPFPPSWISQNVFAMAHQQNSGRMNIPTQLEPPKSPPSPSGLDLLKSVAAAEFDCQAATIVSKPAKVLDVTRDRVKKPEKMPGMNTGGRMFVEEPTDFDILCGRGGRSNHVSRNP